MLLMNVEFFGKSVDNGNHKIKTNKL